MIPNHLIYRIYGDALAVIIDVPKKQTVLLQGDALFFWKNCITSGFEDNFAINNPLFDQLTALGVLKSNHNIQSEATSVNTGTSHRVVDIGVINMWAFKNHIPISGHFELTGRCNLRCRHCYGLFDVSNDMLNINQIVRILDDLHDNGTIALVLTGGELFIRNDILEILEYLNRKKIMIRINTNGTLISSRAIKVMRELTNIYRIHISIYGAEPSIHDTITKVPGSFQKTMYTLHALHEAGFDLRINCSVMQSNIDSYKKIRSEIGDALGIPVHFDSEIFPQDNGGTENLSERLDAHQLIDFKSSYLPNNTTPQKQKLCRAGFSFFSICADGNLLPCLKMKRFHNQTLGNLTKTPFQEIWQTSAKVLDIRNSIGNQLKECNLCDLTI